MRTEDYDYTMTFTSHNRALYIYERLVRKNIQAKLVSAPNKINISCTQAVKFKEMDIEVVQKELQKNNIYPTAMYKIIKEGKNETYELVQ
ncbi:hypothetical protein B0P06_000131 [Clostridium saccharoperbutylacetonicum]|uniref:Putative Se/S carrier protein-like domain-containing protein n=1 Tax=Clostridium saccharoperbutylacetonicum N1-4(HMT) TaxID=931276 RepID=M1MCY6_9CLOT|nr:MULTISPECIES: DUF3343 domain-containing protein [Clostridium]AGF55754.1 hypothetical protein DUF3343 [Clostridium saccharoperbutylacetonicum N1-4(HMT)]NRT63514.1 hypothetical protein [Clostridium saccharoperbutylacetonicum]NSB26877.1 hypothetical protein [Clostridium saccharoperbutylacetonicum]NSB40360.1 hypothetical protein [Clostridium saccharoperbutylacetonicum]